MFVTLFRTASKSAAIKTYVIEHENKIYLQSFDKIICIYDKDTNSITISIAWTQCKASRHYLLSFLNQYDIYKCKTEKDILDSFVDGRLKIVKELE